MPAGTFGESESVYRVDGLESEVTVIVCAKCQRAMRPKKNGVPFIEMAGENPYKLWMADLWSCQDCGAEVLHTSEFQRPIAEHFHPDFATKIQSYAPRYEAREWNR